MRNPLRNVIGLTGLLVVLAALLAPAPAMAAGLGGPSYFPNVPLTTQDGKVVHFYDDLLKGKNVVINVMYTKCSLSCPLETAKLSQVQHMLGDRVGKDIFFYSITIDPKNDTPKVLKAYAEKFHAGPGWLFLTGKGEDIQLISKRLGLSSLTDATNPDGHQPALMLGKEATGQWMRNSAVDNTKFLTTTVLHFFDGYGSKPVQSYANMEPLRDVSKGEYLFQTRCNACHTIGKGESVGPDLLNVTQLRDRAWLARYVARPDLVLAEGDPIAKQLFARYKSVRMPNLQLTAEDVDALLPYIEQLSRAAMSSSTRTK
jgi:protein SCO1/2